MFNIHLSIERWKWNSEFGIYVSNMGRFRSRDKKDLPIKIDRGGYCVVHCEGTVNGFRKAHRVVMITWRPNDDAENLTVDHLDHNKRNNAVSNLEWVTEKENTRRAVEDFVAIADTSKPPELKKAKRVYNPETMDPSNKEECKMFRERMKQVRFYVIKPANRAGGNPARNLPICYLDYTKKEEEASNLMEIYGDLEGFTTDKLYGKILGMQNGAHYKRKTKMCGLEIRPVFDMENM